MLSFNEYLDKLSIIKILSFFLLIMLVLTLIPLLFNFYMGNLLFKLFLYGIMLIFFAYKLNEVIFIESDDEDSLGEVLKRNYDSIFDVSNIYQISFIVIANILFVSAIFFILTYLSGISLIQFDSHLFGDFSALDFDVLLIYFLTVVILSPIIEELLFRGVFLRRFYQEFSYSRSKSFLSSNALTLSILISSILFGFCHGFGGILGAILFGICVSILYIKSKNILVPIFAHFLNNLISFILALSGLEYFIYNNQVVIFLIIILAIISNIVLFRAIFKEWPKSID